MDTSTGGPAGSSTPIGVARARRSKRVAPTQSVGARPQHGRPSIRMLHHLGRQSSAVTVSDEEEREKMFRAEMEQTLVDKFWGLDKHMADLKRERESMKFEDKKSALLEQFYRTSLIQQEWEADEERFRQEDAYAAAVEEEFERQKYLHFVQTAETSSEVIKYKWPSKVHVSPNSSVGEKGSQGAAAEKFDVRVLEMIKPSATVHLDGLQQSRVLAGIANSHLASANGKQSPTSSQSSADRSSSTGAAAAAKHSRASSRPSSPGIPLMSMGATLTAHGDSTGALASTIWGTSHTGLKEVGPGNRTRRAAGGFDNGMLRDKAESTSSFSSS